MSPDGSAEPARPTHPGDASAADLRTDVGLRMFSSVSEAPRARRPTDVALLIAVGLGIGISVLVGRDANGLERAMGDLLASLPSVLDGIWLVLHDLPAVWAFVLLVMALVARARLALARDLVLAGVLAAGIGTLTHHVVEGAWPEWQRLLAADQPPATYPAIRLGVAAGVIITASPHLSRPLRRWGRWVLGLGAVGTLFTGSTSLGGVLGALLIGAAAGATVHLVFGSPGGRPSLRAVAAAVVELGVEVHDLRPANLQPAGVWTILASDGDDRPVAIRVYGRDAWDSQLVTSVWRFLWYRGSATSLRLSGERQVEHEGLLLALAADAGVGVPRVRAAGRARSGDSVLVVDADFIPLDAPGTDVSAVALGLWADLDRAHRAALSPGSLEPSSVGRTADGRPVMADWADGQSGPAEQQRQHDRAQLLMITALAGGAPAAIETARAALGTDDLVALLPYVQPSTASPPVRHALRSQGEDLGELRDAVASATGAEVPELVQLRRVTVGAVVQAALLLLATATIVAAFAGMDLSEAWDELTQMAVGGVVITFVVAQLARASGAVSTIGASPGPLPLGPVLLLQFAIAYINLAVPSAAGRLATMMRFFQRVGSTAATALGVGALDSMANFAVQIGTTIVILGFGLGSLQLDLTSALGDLDGDSWKLVVLVVGVLVVGVVLVLSISSVRRRVLPAVSQVKDGLAVLRSPSKVAMILGGNLLTQVLFAVCLSAAAGATGAEVGVVDALLINNIVSLFAGMLPIPGGVGVSEAGLSAGLVAVGMAQPAALAASLLHRLATAYVPPVFGWFALRSLREQRYL